MQPGGALGRAVIYATTVLQDEAIAASPVWTGTLRSSHRIEASGLRGRVYIAPNQNPITGGAASQYGPVIHTRGGRYAFYGNAFDRGASRAAAGASQIIIDEIK